MWTRPSDLPPWLVNALVAVSLAVAVTLAALAADEPDSRPSAVAAYALGAAVGGLALFRRRWPVLILLLTAAVVFAYHAINFPAVGSWPLVVGLYTCAAYGRLRPALLVVAGWTLFSLAYLLLVEGGPLLPILSGGVREFGTLGLVLAFGDAIHSRRGWATETRERIRQVERERERETTRRITQERVRIARELHDITAHTLAVAAVQLNVAADSLADSPEQARSALRTAQQANREAVAELKAAVRVLRQEQDDALPRSPSPGLDEVERLLEAAREAGLRVDYRQVGPAKPVSAPIGLAVYRIIQESITNVLRHANATSVEVSLGYRPDGLAMRIVDDGTGQTASAGGEAGHGLIGMRERVLGLGGTFAAAPAPAGGFTVSAWIPLENNS